MKWTKMSESQIVLKFLLQTAAQRNINRESHLTNPNSYSGREKIKYTFSKSATLCVVE